jgi:dTDP-glucose 4,6-dehydratase
MSEAILITGGAGFIGSCLVRQLIAEEPAVRIVTLDKLTYAGNLDSLQPVINEPRHKFVQGDVADATLVRELLQTERPSAVIHLAAESHVDRSIDGPAAFVQTNVVGTFTMLDAARDHWKSLPAGEKDIFRFLHVSTDECLRFARRRRSVHRNDALFAAVALLGVEGGVGSLGAGVPSHLRLADAHHQLLE